MTNRHIVLYNNKSIIGVRLGFLRSGEIRGKLSKVGWRLHLNTRGEIMLKIFLRALAFLFAIGSLLCSRKFFQFAFSIQPGTGHIADGIGIITFALVSVIFFFIAFGLLLFIAKETRFGQFVLRSF